MDSIWYAVVVFSFFVIMKCLDIFKQRQDQKFELAKLKIRNSRINVVAPLAVNLIGELTKNSMQIPEDTRGNLIAVLNKIVNIIRTEPTNRKQIEEQSKGLEEILNNGNLAADIAIKVQQILEGISSD